MEINNKASTSHVQSDLSDEDYEHIADFSNEELDLKIKAFHDSCSRNLKTEDENDIADIPTESKIDIGELKKEISDIIDKQCVEIDSKSEWSSKLSFFNLLTILRVNERDELSIPIVFVGLLHLASERGLKLFQEHCIVNDMEETFIAKPINKD
ncbi:hypothetical protein ACI65C_006847 [Semiaphis heraclei]